MAQLQSLLLHIGAVSFFWLATCFLSWAFDDSGFSFRFSVYELGDAKICKKLETIFAPSKEVIMSSPLPGANILAKHLFKKQ